MLKHIVLFKLKDQAEGKTKQENAERIKKDLESLKAMIPQIKHLEVGINAIPSEAAHDIAIYSEFANEKDLGLYSNHPEHVRVAGFVKKVMEGRVVVDYLV